VSFLERGGKEFSPDRQEHLGEDELFSRRSRGRQRVEGEEGPDWKERGDQSLRSFMGMRGTVQQIQNCWGSKTKKKKDRADEPPGDRIEVRKIVE